MTQDVYNDMLSQAQRRVKHVQDRSNGEDIVAAAVKLLADMEALGTHIGLIRTSRTFRTKALTPPRESEAPVMPGLYHEHRSVSRIRRAVCDGLIISRSG